jgi:chemotaxis regulatin CheY-phosphate phosphatase CheZ
MTVDPRALANLSTADYEAIELAVMETARGRWFLKEFAARNRQADTTVLLDAIARLEGAVSGEQAMAQIERVRFDLVEMAKSITGLKAELETQENGEDERSRFGAATSALDGIVRTTEQATSSILGAAEQVQEIAWSLREQQFDEATCDTIDKLATEIYTACGFQDLTAQRTQKVVRTLRFLEGRINALIDAWANKAPGEAAHPADPDNAYLSLPTVSAPPDLSQSDIDFVIVDDPFQSPDRESLGREFSSRDKTSDMPDNVMSALSMAEAVSDINQLADEMKPLPAAIPVDHAADGPPEDWMADDDHLLIIDDIENIEVDFVEIDDVVTLDEGMASDNEAALAPMPSPRPDTAPSMAKIDAMPATAKALIFG